VTAGALADGRAEAERRDALRALLARPLLLADRAPEAFAAVVRHRVELVRWFAENAGWALVVDAGGRHARLLKRAARPDPTRPARAPGKGPFDRRRYVLLALALAALDDEPVQVTLARLAEKVRELSLEDDALAPFDPDAVGERRAFVDVVRLLEDLGVLAFRDGDADRYARAPGEGDALYDVRERLLSRLLAAPRPPALAAGPADLGAEERAATEEGERTAARHAVFRRLLDDPVVYKDELDPRGREWLAAGSGFLYERLARDAGLQVERRAEGLAGIDPAGTLTDVVFPEGGSTVKHAALLLCEWLAEAGGAPLDSAPASGAKPVLSGGALAPESKDSRRPFDSAPPSGGATLRANGGEDWIPWRDVVARVRALQAEHAGRWSKEYEASDAGAGALAREAVRLLAGFGLAALAADGGLVPRPACARFAPRAPSGGAP
jgi:uncharacterized protein (TIGR02678 family)